jgi:hypothetical protein
MKACFARLEGVDPASLTSLKQRLPKITFDANNDVQVTGVDVRSGALSFEAALRKKVEVPEFSADKNALVTAEAYTYRRLLFTIEPASGVISTPGAKRDFNLGVELLKRAGAGNAEVSELRLDLLSWARGLLKMYDDAQLNNIVLDAFYAEPKLIGRYSAKSVDNRLELKQLDDISGQLRSLRYGFFYYGVRRSVEARVDSVISVSSGEEDDLEHFFAEQAKLLLEHSKGKQAGEHG